MSVIQLRSSTLTYTTAQPSTNQSPERAAAPLGEKDAAGAANPGVRLELRRAAANQPCVPL